MLRELRIRDLGVIHDVTLELAPGLNVLTGETGAGKTMVVSALELLLGARAEADRVRAGSAAAIIEGCLSPPPPGSADWLEDADGDLIVAREVAADGAARSRAHIGGRMAPVSALTRHVGAAVELHGQSDTARLATPAKQRELLDRSGGAPVRAAADRYRDSYTRWRAATNELQQLRAGERERAREVDRLAFELDEIDGVGLQPGEEHDLAEQLRRLEHAETLTAGAAAAAAAISDDGGGRDTLATAAAALRSATGVDPELDALHDRVTALAAEVQEAGIDLARYAAAVDLDPPRLAALRDRWAALARLTRKYGEGSTARPGDVDTAAVAAYADGLRDRLGRLRAGDDRAAALTSQLEAMQQALTDAAGQLRAQRRAAGARLSRQVHAHLAELAMADARLDVRVEPAEPAEHGADRVAFLLAANHGEPALPLGRAASGGERSRVALALRLALADVDDTPVLVFDEVDAGIGGATALALGRKLARLARGHQVVCVTHLAQLAAFADAHFVVAKVAGSRAVATVTRLTETQRVAELSRMLSGSTDSVTAAGHASELRESARAETAA